MTIKESAKCHKEHNKIMGTIMGKMHRSPEIRVIHARQPKGW